MAGRIRVAAKEDRTYDGIVFASKKEMLCYINFKMLLNAGVLKSIELQPRFPLVVNGHKICTYVSDFRCVDKDGVEAIYDAKGMKTDTYRIKSKLFHALYPHLRIVEL